MNNEQEAFEALQGCAAAKDAEILDKTEKELISLTPLNEQEVQNPSIPMFPCFKCGVPTNETQSVHGVGHYQCFMGGRK